MVTMVEIDYNTLAREYFLEYITKGKTQQWPESGFGETYDHIIAQYEHFILDKKVPPDKILKMIKDDARLKDLLGNDIEETESTLPASFVELPEKARLDPHLARGACKWLDTYEAFSKEASPEGYEHFHVFCGMWALSTVNARRAYIQAKKMRFCGNLMLAMCADTTLFAKSSTARVATDLLQDAGLSFFLGPDRCTPQKLINNMTGTRIPIDYSLLPEDKKAKVYNKIAMAGQKGLYLDEFGKFIQGTVRKNSTTSDFIDLFLTLYNCPPEYSNETLQRGSDVVEKPYLALLGSMTYANLNQIAAPGAEFWTDGFWARIGFIAAPPDQYIIHTADIEDLPTPPELIMQLRRWHERLEVTPCLIEEKKHPKTGEPTGEYTIERGELPQHCCTIDKDAENAWKQYRISLKEMLPNFPHTDFHGSYGRLPDLAINMAICMASLENNNHIELRHWARAQELAEILRVNLHQLYDQVSIKGQESNGSKMDEAILHEIKQFKKEFTLPILMNRRTKLKKYGIMEVSVRIEAMVKAGVLTKETVTNPSNKTTATKYHLVK
jgi:Protein of unknown function (DUF3987)